MFKKTLLVLFVFILCGLLLMACGTFALPEKPVDNTSVLPGETTVTALATIGENEAGATEFGTLWEQFLSMFGWLKPLWEQLVAIVATAGIPVVVANLLKYVFKKMDGKTDIVVNCLTVALFVAGIALHFYDPNLLMKILPMATEQAQRAGQFVTVLFTLAGVFGLSPVIYKTVKNRIPVLGRSFSKK